MNHHAHRAQTAHPSHLPSTPPARRRRRSAVVAALLAALSASTLAVATTGGTASAAVPVRGTYTPVDPVRILDTRDGTGVVGQRVGPLGIGQVIELDVTGVGGVPETGAGAVVLNVTVTEAPQNGYVTVYPCGDLRPLASNLNFRRGVNVANQVTAKIGRDGHVCFFASSQTHLVADLGGWYADDVATVPGFFYEQLSPQRIVDTRDGTGLGSRAIGQMAAGEVLAVTIPGAGGVPADADVRAATMNVTATGGTSAGYISVFPCDRERPVVSNVNFDPSNPTIANLATSRTSSTGQVCFYASAATDLVVDIQGYFTPQQAVVFTALTPERALDTRDGTGIVGSRPTKMGRGSVLRLHIAGEHGVPTDAAAVMLNVTITEADGRGYVTAWPCGQVRPVASFLNFVRGVDQANLTPVRIGQGGDVCLFVNEGTEVVADVNGYYQLAV